jgi:fermentation-respiration switch protein FrsA (DUF1100 family)
MMHAARTLPESDDVAAERVAFSSHGASLIGNVFRPVGLSPAQRAPAIVVTGSWLTVKEQMPNLYAHGLARAGFVSLSFDFRGYGESEGEPREYESPARKAEDIRAAITHLQSAAQVDPTRIGALAVCASSGYAAAAAIEDERIRSLACIAPWLHDAALVRQMYGGESGVAERVAKGLAARARYAQTGVVDLVPAVSATDPNAAMCGDFDYYLDTARGGIAAWGNRMAVMSWPEWLEFDAIALAPQLRTPSLFVHSERAAIPEGLERFYRALTAPKQLRWTDGTQFDFYDRPAQVEFALNAATEHFRQTL